jgi:succinyl-CoA synthetase alpha subunit
MKHTRRMLASGASVVGGVNARKAGTSIDFDGTSLPVFGSVAEAMGETGANVTVGFVPPAFTKDSVIEAVDAQIPLAVVITEGVAVHDTAAFWAYAQATQLDGDGRKLPSATRIVGTNAEEAARILAEAGDPDLQTAESLDEAVERAVAAATQAVAA